MNYQGSLAERYVSNYLRKKGYILVDYNYHTRFGEIDLIMTKKRNIIFIEVKERNVNSIAEPKEFVDYGKQKKFIASAQEYLQFSKTKLQPRFDVVEVFSENGKIKSIKVLENAFTLD